MGPNEWEKVLWKKQDFPDNYIPRDSFLSALKKNRKQMTPKVSYSNCNKILTSRV